MCERCGAGLHRRGHPGRPRGVGKLRPDTIPVAPFRERALALVAAGISWEELGRWTGYDGSRLKVMVGARSYTKTVPARSAPGAKYRYRYTQRNITRTSALRLARGLGMDPVEGGV